MDIDSREPILYWSPEIPSENRLVGRVLEHLLYGILRRQRGRGALLVADRQWFPDSFIRSEVIARGMTHADWKTLQGKIEEISASVQNARSVDLPVIDLLRMRAMVPILLEYFAKPVEGISQFLTDYKITKLIVGSHQGEQERILKSIAGEKKTRIEKSGSDFLFSTLLSFVRKIAVLRRAPPSAKKQMKVYPKTRKDPPNLKGTVLFFGLEERRFVRYAEIANSLKSQGIPAVIAGVKNKTETMNALKKCQDAGHQTAMMDDFLSSREAKHLSIHYEKQRIKSKPKLNHAIESGNHLYKGVPYGKTIQARLNEIIDLCWTPAAVFAHAIEWFFSKSRPALIFLSDNGLHSSVIAAVARKMGIPTVYYAYNPVLYGTNFWIPLVSRNFRTDYVFVSTDRMKQIFVEDQIVKSENIFVCGDVFIKNKTESRPLEITEKRSKFGISLEEKTLLILSNYVSQEISRESKIQMFEDFALVKREIPNLKILVKAHPNENLEVMRKEMSEGGLVADVFQHEPLSELLSVSDTAVMMFSQAGNEVLMAGVPLLLYQNSRFSSYWDQLMPFSSEGAAYTLVPGKLDIQKIRDLLFNPETRTIQIQAGNRFIQKYISQTSTPAITEIVNSIKQVMK